MTDESIIKRTDELMKELEFNGTDINDYLKDNPDSFIEINLKEFWNEMIEKSGMSKYDIINKSDYSYNYFYEVIGGKRIPSADKVLRLALALHLELEDCQKALRYCGYAPLYPRIKRDSIIIYAINNNYSVFQTIDLLNKSGEKNLK